MLSGMNVIVSNYLAYYYYLYMYFVEIYSHQRSLHKELICEVNNFVNTAMITDRSVISLLYDKVAAVGNVDHLISS